MKLTSCIRFFGALLFLTSLPIASAQTDTALLDQSYNLGQSIGGQEQLFYFAELCRVSAHPNPPAETAMKWCLMLFRVASTEQGPELPAIGQKNAVTQLSYIDPAAAMELLTEINFQRPTPGDWVYEDPRYNAAEETFVNFLTKVRPESASNIIAKARYLGQTGQYPYRAVASVIHRLPASLKGEANTFLSDALRFYADETGFYNRDEEFLVLLQSLSGSGVDKNLAARAAATFVQRLKTDPIHLPGDYYAEVHTVSTGKAFPFTDRNDAFLFEAFPEIRRFNPQLASQLSEQDPKLDHATDDMHYLSGGFVQGDPTSAQATRQHLQWLQESLVSRIKEKQDCNPESAAHLAQRLTDLSLRIAGFSAAIPGIARSNTIEARAIYEKQLSELGNLGDSVGKLRAMVALAPAAFSLGDSQQYQSLTGQAFDMGVRLFTGGVSARRAARHDGFNELKDLVTFSASQPTDTLKSKVQNLPDGWLKAYLLLYEVEGHQRLKAPPVAVKPCPD